MKKVVFLLLTFVLLSVVFVGCDTKVYHWEFEQPYANVEEIQIIQYDTNNNYEVVKELNVSLAETIFSEIENIDYNRYGWNLASTSEPCFLIIFSNGEYDIISEKEPSHFRKDENGELNGYNSWLECKNNQFDDLIKNICKTADGDLS